MASPSVTYTFANGTAADASQVNTNFNDILNGLSDGTKDFSINALTCAGTATLNGNVNLGNASGDDLSITASLATSLSMKTTFLNDFGSATIGLKSVYFGDASSAARTTRVIGASVASSWTLTLPVGPGTSGYVFQTDGAGVGSWVSKTSYKVVTATTTYAVLATDETIYCDATSASFVATLPTAAGAAGKRYTLKKIDTGANTVTLATTSSQTVGLRASSSVILNKIWDYVTVESDNTNWQIIAIQETGGTAYLTNKSQKTIVAGSGAYQNTSATVTLGIGKWRIRCNFQLQNGTSTLMYVNVASGIYAADGSDTTTPPTTLTAANIVGQNLFTGVSTTGYAVIAPQSTGVSLGFNSPFLDFILYVPSGTQAIYAVPVITYTSGGGTTTVQTFVEAQRVM